MSERSSIPDRAEEVPGYLFSDGDRSFECVLNGEVVGYRLRNVAGTLVHEHGIKNAKKHGFCRDWEPDGTLEFESFYVDGLEHGTARQWRHGELVCSYTMDHGTGAYVCCDDDGRLSEEWQYLDGERHGVVRSWSGDEKTVRDETYYWKGEEHGIYREWNDKGRLQPGYPHFLFHGWRVTKLEYLRLSAADPTLPPYVAEENRPERELPAGYAEMRDKRTEVG